MTARNEKGIEQIREQTRRMESLTSWSGDWCKDVQFLLSEIDFRDMLISDLKQESSAYEQGKSEANEVLLSLLRQSLQELERHNEEYHYETSKQFLTDIRSVLGIAEEAKKTGSCKHCHERDRVNGDMEGRCRVCIDENWVMGRRGWRQLGEYDG